MWRDYDDYTISFLYYRGIVFFVSLCYTYYGSKGSISSMEKLCRKRESNFELLRIISMIFIIFHHLIVHSTYNFSLSNKVMENDFLVALFQSGGKFGVVLFVMITGYYMINSNIKMKKLILLEGQVLFYSIFICFIFVFFMGKELVFSDLITYLMPNINKVYWFFSSYFILYLLISYINKLLLGLEKREYIRLLFIGFVFLILLPTIFIFKENVSGTIYLIYYYMIGAYIRLFGKEVKGANNLLVGFILSYLAIPVISIYIKWLSLKNFYLKDYIFTFSELDSIFVFVSSICLFLFFKNLKIKYSRVINWLGSASFGVYLFHEHPLVRDFFFKRLFLTSQLIDSGFFLGSCIFITVFVYMSGTLFEVFRKGLAKVIKSYFKMLFSKST